MMIQTKATKEMWTNIYKALTALNAENVEIRASKDGWRVNQTDPSRVGMVSIKIPDIAFASYECQDCAIAIPMAALKSMLAVFDSEIETTVDEKGLLTMKAGNIRRTCRTVEVQDEPKIPGIQCTVSAQINATKLLKVMSISDYTDYITVRSSEKGLQFETAGDTDSTEIDYPMEGLETAQAAYPLEYIRPIIASLPSDVMISFADDYPCMIAVEEPFSIRFLLAPRIEDSAQE